MHFYQILPDFNAKFLPDVETEPQAKKHSAPCYASVTTKLDYAPHEFLELWMKRQCIKLTKLHPSWEEQRILDSAWGLRIHPDGSIKVASEFGTELHKEFEKATEAYKLGSGYRSRWFQDWTDMWVQWLKKNKVEVIATEMLVGDATRQTAGAIDQLLKIGGKYVLADFKTRVAGNAKLSTKHYFKDCMQLAVEADIIRMKFDLDYMPRIYTIIVECTEADMHCKLWTESMQDKALRGFDIVNNFYNQFNAL